ncbi:hypothetical protein Y032_0442g1536 [Ancylostoma ceylanicum]|uniref:Hyaluronidase n=1 Tax=Ancylostoma ceylanicum TaxID=53326 RepID=A0A016X184_9BILA|nr:hypothetical protein Y032_0442g1536 [Ancylostoma ceylanicum]
MTGPYDDCNLYTTTNEVFQNESIKLATKKYSNESDPTRLKQLAEKDYNEAARDFFIKTIKKARDLRPHAKWGFYGFPYCNYDAGSKGEYRCKDNYQEWNDRMMFIFNESRALYPSIYLGFNASSEQRFRYVQNCEPFLCCRNFGRHCTYELATSSISWAGHSDARKKLHEPIAQPNIYAVEKTNSTNLKSKKQEKLKQNKAILKEARRISEMFKPPLPIYAYTKIEYDPLEKLNDFYNDSDLCTTLKQPADLGIDGVVLWSSSANMKDRCQYIESIMDTKIGPCPGEYDVVPDKYDCECDIGYSGNNCSSTSSSSST